jgi:hypothetical protein
VLQRKTKNDSSKIKKSISRSKNLRLQLRPSKARRRKILTSFQHTNSSLQDHLFKNRFMATKTRAGVEAKHT